MISLDSFLASRRPDWLNPRPSPSRVPLALPREQKNTFKWSTARSEAIRAKTAAERAAIATNFTRRGARGTERRPRRPCKVRSRCGNARSVSFPRSRTSSSKPGAATVACNSTPSHAHTRVSVTLGTARDDRDSEPARPGSFIRNAFRNSQICCRASQKRNRTSRVSRALACGAGLNLPREAGDVWRWSCRSDWEGLRNETVRP
jgi:hypothetical protein